MRKTAIFVMAAAAIMKVTALAAPEANINNENSVWQENDNSVSASFENLYTTALITKYDTAEDDTIYYVNQDSENGFNSTTRFFMLEDPEAGKYLLSLGSNNAENGILQIPFIISRTAGDDPNAKVMDRITEDDKKYEVSEKDGIRYKNIAFKLMLTGDELNAIKTVVVKTGDSVLGYSLQEGDMYGSLPSNIDGNSAVIAAIEIQNVPEEYWNNISVALSERTAVYSE